MDKIELTKEEQVLIGALVWQVTVNGETVKLVSGLMDKFPEPEKKEDVNQG